jgi:deoxyxylulose-5-phosphate synthase
LNKNVIVLEENVKAGGFGSFIAETLSENKIICNLNIRGFDDKFVAHASVLEQLESVGLTKTEILKLLKL